MNEPLNPEVAILNAALELPADQRAVYLDGACVGDAALRGQVEALLQAHRLAEDFLQAPPTGLEFKLIARVNIPLTEKPGDRIGRYKLLQQIGEGGCGVVYMAEQEEPVRRRVALKVIKLGMDTKSVIARFEAERQALALMDHPNIAKVLDAGATETGRPYFVMELVRGTRITEFCDENKLSTADRLKLFIQVCQAIQHAHQKGVIHRDIKPSNILVTINDGVPVPKVIDFGIAKATQGRLTDHTLFTAFEQFIGTPAYMSPEQAVMTSLDIDTRSDIYSLGVLLYELLTGRPPFDQKELLAAGLDEMRRTIREVEPVKPSTRLTQELVADDVRRRTGKSEVGSASLPRRLQELIHHLRGDLDWIAMKCLEKDRARCYETANGLAADIQLHLDNEPVNARPPSGFYRLQKSVRRNKGAFAATAAIAIVLVIGVVVSALEAFRATRAEREQTRQRQIAETKEKKSEQVAQFLTDMLQGISPSVAKGRDTTLLREILDKTAERVGKDLANDPEVAKELYDTIGSVYWELGDNAKAEAMHRREVAIWRNQPPNKKGDALPLLRLAVALGGQGKFEEAEALQREALASFKEFYGTNKHRRVAFALSDLSGSLAEEGRLVEAESALREALVIRRELLGNEHQDVAHAIWGLGRLSRKEHKLAVAESYLREALAMFRKIEGNDNGNVVNCLNDLAVVLEEQGRLAEAEDTQREAVTIERKFYDQEHPHLAGQIGFLAGLLQKQGKLAETESLYREVLMMEGKLYGSEHISIVHTLGGLCGTLDRAGKFAEAEAFLRQLVALQRKLLGNESQAVVNTLPWLAAVLDKQHKFADEEILLRETLALQRKLLGDGHPKVLETLDRLKWTSASVSKPQ